MFIASVHSRLKWTALQTLRRPLVDYWADSQWTINPEIMVHFGCILYVCVSVYIMYTAYIVSLCMYDCSFLVFSDGSGWLLPHTDRLRWNAATQPISPVHLPVLLGIYASVSATSVEPDWLFCTVLLATSNMTSGFRVSFFLHLISFSQWVSWGYTQYPFCEASLGL